MLIQKKKKDFDCPYLKPCKQSRGERVVVTKRCNAFLPTFEVDAEKQVCAYCSVREVLDKKERCQFLAALDITGGVTRYKCSKTGRKYLEPETCTAKNCPHFVQYSENLKPRL
ncbi:MAG: hypothetical protein M1536_04895 [Firmicutes bacterium]|nr:hypothetical protein [Bacillota bacterium]